MTDYKEQHERSDQDQVYNPLKKQPLTPPPHLIADQNCHHTAPFGSKKKRWEKKSHSKILKEKKAG